MRISDWSSDVCSSDLADAFTAETGIRAYQWSVADYDECVAGVKQVERDLGPVDIVVNNAGITRDGTLHKMSCEQWQTVMDTNVGGCFNLSRAVIDGMRESGFGRIVNIGSINGQRSEARRAGKEGVRT